MARWSRLLIALSVAAAGLAVPAAPMSGTVGAADDPSLGKLLLFGEDGTDTTTIGPNGAADVWLGQIDYLCDFFYPTADIYVVSGTPGAGGTLTDVSGAPNVVFGSWGGGFSETIAYAQPSGKLGPGTYSVVYDECQNGKYEPGIDALFVDAITVVFPPGELPPINPAIAAIKGQAGSAATVARAMLDGYKLYEKLAEAYEMISCIAGGIAGCAASMAIDALKGFLIDAAPGDVRPARHQGGRRRPRRGRRPTVRGHRSRSTGPQLPATDDPRPDRQLRVERGERARRARLRLSRTPTAVDAALAEGLLHAIERYQGADAADDAAWARQHLTQARDFAALLADHQSVTNAAIQRDARRRGQSTTATSTTPRRRSSMNRTRVVADGFSPAELGCSPHVAMSAADSRRRSSSSTTSTLPPMRRRRPRPRSSPTSTADDRREHRMGDVARRVSSASSSRSRRSSTTNALSGGRPMPDAGGPYTEGRGIPVPVGRRRVERTPSGSIASSAWDVDIDRAFDDATGLTPTVTVLDGTGRSRRAARRRRRRQRGRRLRPSDGQRRQPAAERSPRTTPAVGTMQLASEARRRSPWSRSDPDAGRHADPRLARRQRPDGRHRPDVQLQRHCGDRAHTPSAHGRATGARRGASHGSCRSSPSDVDADGGATTSTATTTTQRSTPVAPEIQGNTRRRELRHDRRARAQRPARRPRRGRRDRRGHPARLLADRAGPRRRPRDASTIDTQPTNGTLVSDGRRLRHVHADAATTSGPTPSRSPRRPIRRPVLDGHGHDHRLRDRRRAHCVRRCPRAASRTRRTSRVTMHAADNDTARRSDLHALGSIRRVLQRGCRQRLADVHTAGELQRGRHVHVHGVGRRRPRRRPANGIDRHRRDQRPAGRCRP